MIVQLHKELKNIREIAKVVHTISLHPITIIIIMIVAVIIVATIPGAISMKHLHQRASCIWHIYDNNLQ